MVLVEVQVFFADCAVEDAEVIAADSDGEAFVEERTDGMSFVIFGVT